ncbi:MAG: hypothetical protein ACYDEX_02130, partial [Mobilitalea sp.]
MNSKIKSLSILIRGGKTIMKNKFNHTLRKLLSVALVVGLLATMLTGCTKQKSDPTDSTTTNAAGVTSAAGTSTDMGNEPKKITFVMGSDVGDLSPFGGDSGGRHHTYRMMYNCLSASAGLGASVDQLEGQMAKTVTVVDSTTVDVEIYDYIHDSLGNAIKASDVVYSYNQAIASGTM